MYTKNLFKEMFFSLKFIVSFPIASGAIARERTAAPGKRDDTDNIQELPFISKRISSN